MSERMNQATEMADVDSGTPNVARMYDYFLGGKNNFIADRRAAEEVAKAVPNVTHVALENRRFLQRAVRLAAEQGIDQFLDLGSGLPTRGNVHEIAQAVDPRTRVVYVDNDPVVIAHARALLDADERCAVVQADLRDPEVLLAQVREQRLIDFGRPLAVLFVAVLHFITDEEDPGGLMRRYRDALPPGGHVVLSHAALEEERNLSAATAYRRANAPLVTRTREQVAAFLDGLEIVEPGVVHLHEWRPDGGERPITAGWAAVARKAAS